MTQAILRLHEGVDGPVLAAFQACTGSRTDGDAWAGRWTVNEIYCRWKFAGLPQRPALLAAAWVGDCIAGTMSLRPLPAVWNGRAVMAAEVGDLFVAPELRGQGILGKLAHLLAEGARRHGYQLVFSIPNPRGLEALLRSGEFVLAPQAERLLCVLPLTPSAFMPKAFRGLARVLVDPVMRGWMRLCCGGNFCEIRQGLPSALPNIGDDDTVRIGTNDSFLTHRSVLHPDAARYLVCQDDGGWAAAKPAEHLGRPFLLIGAIKGPTASGRRRLLRGLVAQSLDCGRAAVALWAPRADLWSYLGLTLPFFPAARKQVVLLRTTLSEELIIRQTKIQIELLDTDKI